MATPDKALSLCGMFRPAAACSVFVGIGHHQNQSSMLSVEVQASRISSQFPCLSLVLFCCRDGFGEDVGYKTHSSIIEDIPVNLALSS